MKTRLFTSVLLFAALTLPAAFTAGCAKEVSHTESDKPNMLGGHTHEETTVYKNPDGTYSVEHEKQRTNP